MALRKEAIVALNPFALSNPAYRTRGARAAHDAVAIPREAIVVTPTVEGIWRWMPMLALVLMFTAILFQPALPEDQPQQYSAIEDALGWAIVGGLPLAYLGTWYLSMRGSRAGLVWSAPVTLLMLLLVLSCPASGHHSWGAWVIPSFGTAIFAAGLHGASLYATRQRMFYP
jgi:hypothetical protein